MIYSSSRKLIVLICVRLILASAPLLAQEPGISDIEGVVNRYIKSYFPDPFRTISTVTSLGDLGIDEVYLVDLEPEGWFLVSGDLRAESVLAFSPEGEYHTGKSLEDNPANSWVSSYSSQVDFIKTVEEAPVSRSWDYTEGVHDDLKADDIITVSPLIEVNWNQGKGWNAYCPEDAEGPDGRVYVGCVAVAMGQAMSVYGYPVRGNGIHSYYHPFYGTLEVDYSKSEYLWEQMSAGSPDTLNAKLLYQNAVSVNMNFGPDGSSASSSAVPEALRTHFLYSKFITYQRSSNFTELSWKKLILDELSKGHPLIYRGEPADGSSAHAFNIDGVIENNLFHLNWGWGGTNNGYYLLTALSPGTRDYSYDHGAVVRIKPYYYPTDLFLSNYIVPEDEDAGAEIGTLVVIDEATDNEYTIVIESDSTFVDGLWVDDYYLDGNILKTGRSFTKSELDKDTVWFTVTDLYGNELIVETELLFSGALDVDHIDGNINDDILIYPNPASNQIQINTFNEQPLERIIIYSIDGRPVMMALNPDSNPVIDLSALPAGTYIVMVEWVNGIRAMRKVIKN